MAVPHAVHTAVSPQRKDLPDDRHPAQSAVSQLHDLSVTDLLENRQTHRQIVLYKSHFMGLDSKLFSG